MTAIESIQRFFGNSFPKVDNYVRIPYSVFLNGDVDAREGSAANGVVLGALTLTAATYAYLDDGGVFTDDTTDFNSAGTADVALMPASEAVNDAFYIGHATQKFGGIQLILSTAGVGTAVVYEYYNGSAWVNLATAHLLQDDSTGLTAGTSTYDITWLVPTNWTKTTVDGDSAYWVRIRVTTASFTTVPVASRGYVYALTEGVGVNFPLEGYIDGVSWTADTASGSTDDTVLQLINVTRGTTTSVTITKATKAGHAATANEYGLAFAKGDEFVIQCVDGDATEFADMNLIFEVKA